MSRLIILSFILCLSSCANYRLGSPERRLPGGYNRLAIPVFKNRTQETGLEVYFTNALITEFSRADLAELTTRDRSQLILMGEVTEMSVIPGSKKTPDGLENKIQPEGTVLAVDYRVTLVTRIRAIDAATKKTVWNGSFSGERSYNGSQVTLPVINSVNPNYNLSVKRSAIQTLAAEMMSEAYDRITENF